MPDAKTIKVMKDFKFRENVKSWILRLRNGSARRSRSLLWGLSAVTSRTCSRDSPWYGHMVIYCMLCWVGSGCEMGRGVKCVITNGRILWHVLCNPSLKGLGLGCYLNIWVTATFSPFLPIIMLNCRCPSVEDIVKVYIPRLLSFCSFQGYLYKMRAVYAHFPINCAITEGGTLIEVINQS